MVVVAVRCGGKHGGRAACQCLQELLHILAGADIHFRGDAPINAVADADIFHPAAVVHNQVQLLPSLLRGMADLKLPQAAGFLLLQDIATVGGDDIGPGCPDHGKVLHDHLAADPKPRGQVFVGNGGIGLVKQGQDFFPALCGRHTGAPFPIRLSSSASFMAFATSFRMGSVNSIAPAAHRCKRMAKIPGKRLGFLGLPGFLGLLGLPADRGSFPFAFFLFFGFFGFFFEGRMSHALIDKRCTENCAKAQLTVDISHTVEAPIEEIFIFE